MNADDDITMIPHLQDNLVKDLYRYLIERDYEAIQEISSDINKLSVFNGCNEFVDVLITEAIDCDDKEVFKLLVNCLEFGKPNENHLKTAILKGNVAVAELLLKNNVRIKNRKWIWKSQVAYSSIFSRTNTRMNMLKLFLSYGLLDAGLRCDDGESFLSEFILHFVRRDDSDAVEFAQVCMEHGLCTEDLDSEQFFSIGSGNIPLITLLIEKGPGLNANNGKQLLHAAGCEYVDVVDLFILKGADINLRDGYGNTALHDACLNGRAENINLLIQKGADVNAKDESGRTPFSWLYPKVNDFSDSIIEMLKEFSKLIFENVLISEGDLKLIEADPMDREHFEKCKKELLQLKNIKCYSSYSFYSLLKRAINPNKLAHLTKNEEIVREFENNLQKLSYYKKDLQSIFNEALQIREESEEVITYLHSVFGGIFPDTVLRKLSKNLTCEDLVKS